MIINESYKPWKEIFPSLLASSAFIIFSASSIVISLKDKSCVIQNSSSGPIKSSLSTSYFYKIEWITIMKYGSGQNTQTAWMHYSYYYYYYNYYCAVTFKWQKFTNFLIILKAWTDILKFLCVYDFSFLIVKLAKV